ncbi:hypothetical protein GQ457_03G013750 [Hibiscus cannabinus]
MDEQWIAPRIKTKGGTQCIAWKFIQELIQAHHGPMKQVDLFALSIYGLVIFPKSLGYIDNAVLELFSSLHKGVNLVPAILAETFQSLTTCKKAGEGRFTGCAQLLPVWFHNMRLSRMIDGWPSSKTSKKKMLFGRQVGFFFPENIIYKCEGFDWVPLLGIWGASGYAPILVSRQYRSRQRTVSLIMHAWGHIYRMEPFDEKPRIVPEYRLWRNRRHGDSVPVTNLECNVPIEENLQLNPSEMKMAKQDFEIKYFEMERQISRLMNERSQLKCPVES